MNQPLGRLCCLLASIGFYSLFISSSPVRADDDDDLDSTTQPAGESHYGFLNLLDHRSKYGHDWFPEPFRVEDTDMDDQIRFDWEHDNSRHGFSNSVELEAEKAFGLVTFEVQVPYSIDRTATTDGVVEEADDGNGIGFGPIGLSARAPVWQVVSPSGWFDNTIGAELAVNFPSNAPAGKNSAIAPALFDDLRLGEHCSVQSLFSFTWTFGDEPLGGSRVFGYAMAFGYTIDDEDFELPGIERFTPSFEVVGLTNVGGDNNGHNSLTGTVGIRTELKSIFDLQPQLGIGYVFPIDQGGRNDLRWGIITSLDFEF